MRENEFEIWLANRHLVGNGISSKLSYCRRVERYEKPDLDVQFDKDGLVGLIGRLVYSKEDESQGRPVRHSIPISGNLYNGTATLRSAISLYKGFRENPIASERPNTNKPSPIHPKPSKGA